MRGLVKLGALLTCVLLAPAAAWAQASLAGTVKDSSGAVLPGVTVEAASPVLIEKARSVVTDGSGNYNIVNLRPGAYTVTFALTGFATVKRENVAVAGTTQTTIDATMRVGQVAETITVTGETPIVDVATTTKEAVLDHDAVQTLPTSRQYFSLARLVPGTNTNSTFDTGGSRIAQVGAGVTIHGSRNVDERITLNGLSIMTLQAGGYLGGQQPDVGSAAEITVETASLSAEMSTGGVRINFIPKDGGNTFSNSTFFTFSNQSLQGNNFTAALQAAGLSTPNAIDKNYDLNESVGGPIMKDRLWFYFSTRFNRANTYAGIFANANAYNPNLWTYAPDTNRPAENKGFVQQNNLRLTWQVTPKIKVAGEQKMDRWCACPDGVSATTSLEAGSDFRFPRLRQEHAEFTMPVTNKLLVEGVGMHLFERWGRMDPRVSTGSLDNQAQQNAIPQMISVQEQSTGLTYRLRNQFNNTRVPNYTYRVAASYVTGSHAFKAGWNDTFGYLNMTTYNFQPVSFRFNNGVPNQVTEWATPYTALSDENHDFGMFAQDQWRLNRFTLNGAIRYDWFKTSFPAQHLEPGLLFPNRSIDFPYQDNLDWKDITWRAGMAWDVRGDGKTAVKAAFNKYLLGQTLNGLGSSPNPVNALVTSTNRSWTDSNGNFVPDCVLTNTAANGECGPADQAFGTTRPGATFDPDLLTGYGHRQANWEFSAGIQQEVLPRISVDVTYFRRIWDNFTVTDNLLASASDFTPFNMVVPADSRLPGGGGYTLSYFDINPNKFGQTQNYNTLSDKYGAETDHWNGVDITVNGRLQNGVSFQAGISTGRDSSNNCAVVAQLPEMLSLSAGPGNGQLAQQFCNLHEPFLTQFKAYGSYTIPKIDVQVAGTFRSVPGLTSGGDGNISGMRANFVADNAYLAANSTLGRSLAGGAKNTTLQIVDPNTVYLDRDNELDLRFGKVFAFGRTKSTINLDLFNALNSSAILSANTSYARWLAPTSITNARLAKISITFDLK